LVAQRELPKLINIATTDPTARPALIVTSSQLPAEPRPEVFSLAMAKAAQRNLMLSLFKQFGTEGVCIGVVTVNGPVSPTKKQVNPENIAARTWDWFTQEKRTFEVEIREC
jgi:hypothetical protein